MDGANSTIVTAVWFAVTRLLGHNLLPSCFARSFRRGATWLQRKHRQGHGENDVSAFEMYKTSTWKPTIHQRRSDYSPVTQSNLYAPAPVSQWLSSANSRKCFGETDQFQAVLLGRQLGKSNANQLCVVSRQTCGFERKINGDMVLDSLGVQYSCICLYKLPQQQKMWHLKA